MKSIAEKLVHIMAECGLVKKNGTNNFHNYKYATSADVLEKVNASLVKHKVAAVAVPEMMDSSDVLTGKGNTEHLVTVKMSITLIDAANGESLTIVGIGSGQDSGDKAVMKAQTAAIKYAYMLTLAMSTSDDPEADAKTDEAMVESAMDRPHKKQDRLNCSDCGATITAGVKQVSTKRFARPLCMKCQKRAQVA